LILENDESEWSASFPSFFTFSERATHWIGEKGGPRTDLDIVEKRNIFYPCPEIRSLALKKIQCLGVFESKILKRILDI